MEAELLGPPMPNGHAETSKYSKACSFCRTKKIKCKHRSSFPSTIRPAEFVQVKEGIRASIVSSAVQNVFSLLETVQRLAELVVRRCLPGSFDWKRCLIRHHRFIKLIPVVGLGGEPQQTVPRSIGPISMLQNPPRMEDQRLQFTRLIMSPCPIRPGTHPILTPSSSTLDPDL